MSNRNGSTLDNVIKGVSTAVFCSFLIVLAPTPLPAKGHTVKIAIKGIGLAAPIEITDDGVGQFHVWSGPGVFVNRVEETEGFIIDWSRGVAPKAPAGLPLYEVSFYSGCKEESGCRTTEPMLVYVVQYAFDPASEQGFAYLPKNGDDLFKFNKMWHGHGFEGNWLFASSAWKSFVRPIIVKAQQQTLLVQ